MIIDALTQFSVAQAITASAASSSVVPLSADRDIGSGFDIYAVAVVTTAFTDAGSDSTVEVRIQADDDEAFGSVDSFQVIGTFGALSAVGAKLIAKLQPGMLDSEFIRGFYTVAGGNLTTGSITFFLTLTPDQYKAYPNNSVIDAG